MTTSNDTTDVFMEDAGVPLVEEAVRAGPIANIAYLLGSVGLLGATAVDSVAVAGRHAGFTFLGSIELVQAAAVLTATSAMVVATALGAHASVHIVTQRLSEKRRVRLARWSGVLGALLFAVISAGSFWVAAEMWPGFEQTEILAIPIKWLRAFWIVGSVLITFLFLLRALKEAE